MAECSGMKIARNVFIIAWGCGAENRIPPGGNVCPKSGVAVFSVSDVQSKTKFYFQSILLSNRHGFRSRSIVFAGVANRSRRLTGKAT